MSQWCDFRHTKMTRNRRRRREEKSGTRFIISRRFSSIILVEYFTFRHFNKTTFIIFPKYSIQNAKRTNNSRRQRNKPSMRFQINKDTLNGFSISKNIIERQKKRKKLLSNWETFVNFWNSFEFHFVNWMNDDNENIERKSQWRERK